MVVGATWEWPWLREFVFGNATGWITQIGLTPVLRWHLFGSSPRVFAEAGIGLNVLVPIFRTTDKQFSTAFNFGDHIAVGMQFGEGGLHEVSLRLQHFSSACIKEPNPGENFVQLRYGMRY